VPFSVVHWLPFFISEPACRIITDSLNDLSERAGQAPGSLAVLRGEAMVIG